MEELTVQMMMVDEWKKNILNSLKGVVFSMIKRRYPFVKDIADINVDDVSPILSVVEMTITFFVSEYPSDKEGLKLDKDVQTMVEMMQQHKIELSSYHKWKLKLNVQLVQNT